MFKSRLKIYLGIALALVVSVFLSPLVQPIKQNKHIPTKPLSLIVSLTQKSSGQLRMTSVAIREHYPSDYQSKFNSNYYTITLTDGGKTLFTGQTVRSYVLISEELDETPEGEISEIPLGDFELNLPFYKNATTLILTEDTGTEALRVDLKQYKLTLPDSKNHCGDGVCADNENVLWCSIDCKTVFE